MTDFRIPSFDPADVADPAARARLDELTRQAREIILARQDPDTGLSYLGARYYSPQLGRFTGIDPKAVDPENLHVEVVAGCDRAAEQAVERGGEARAGR